MVLVTGDRAWIRGITIMRDSVQKLYTLHYFKNTVTCYHYKNFGFGDSFAGLG